MPTIDKTRAMAEIVLAELENTYNEVKNVFDSGLAPCEYELAPRLKAPFVAVAETNQSRLYLCNGYTPLHKPKEGNFVNYYSPIGKFFALEVNGTCTFNSKVWRLLLKHDFEPVRNNGIWDAYKNTLVDSAGVVKLFSLREHLNAPGAVSSLSGDPTDRKEDLEASNAQTILVSQYLDSLRREKVSLPGKYVLNAVQDAVMRTSLEESVILEGLPGTGKTTTTIKLIAKQCYYDENGDWLGENKSWRLYVPTEILKTYVKEAFNKEGIPATDETIITWDEDERMFLGRDVFRFLKVGTNGVFKIKNEGGGEDGGWEKAQEMLRAILPGVCSELGIVAEDEAGLAASFGEKVSEYAASKTELNILLQIISGEYGWKLKDIQGRVAVLKNIGATPIYDVLYELSKLPEESADMLSAAYEAYLQAIKNKEDAQKTHKNGFPIFKGETEIEKNIRIIAERKRELTAIITKTFPSRLTAVLEILCEQTALPKDRSILRKFGAICEKQERLSIYAKQEKDIPAYLASVYIGHAVKYKGDSEYLSPMETDTLIYGLLSLLSVFPDSVKSPLLAAIRTRIVDKIVVDEATDFSPVQIKILMLLCRHGLVLSGDLMQRATTHGLRNWDDAGARFKRYPLNVVYRQNPRLLAIAKEICRVSLGKELEFKSNYPATGITYPPPYLLESLDVEASIKWIGKDIVALYEKDSRVPPTAIFVKDRATIDKLADTLEPILRENALTVERCYEGRMSQHSRIGVFEYRHIKGLEFEAAYLVYPDHICQSLMGRHIYIGATRATQYLRVVCEKFPTEYANAKELFEVVN